MKELLAAIQAELRSNALLSYVADEDITITADPALLPVNTTFPAIALKDGSVEILIEEGADWQRTLAVDIIVYQTLESGDISIVGQASPKIYGVLEISEDIHSVLYDNTLGIEAIETALPVRESMTDLIGADDLVVVARTLTYQYQKLEVNP